MAPTSRVVHDEIDNFLSYLIDAEIAVHVNPLTIEGGRITWRPFPRADRFLESRDGADSVATYQHWLTGGEYSALLFDGGLIQVTYDFAGHELSGHRLAWVPCPFDMDPDYLQLAPFAEVVEMYLDAPSLSLLLRTPIRFDFDIDRVAIDHPASHLSLNSAECRIACAAPLRLGHFADFIFRNFYPDLWRLHRRYLAGISRSPWGPHTVTDEQTELPHLSWRR